MLNLLSYTEFTALNKERENTEKKVSADEQRSVFEKYSATERFEDIVNTIKAICFKIEFSEKKKKNPDPNIIAEYNKMRLYLADIQQRHIKSFSVNMMEKSIDEQLLPELKSLKSKYPNI